MDAEGIREIFEPFGAVSLKRMFGGHGIYRHGRIIAIEADGVIWMKTDAESREAFSAAGSRPFSYATGKGEVTIGSYWALPEAAFDDPDELRRWAALAEAAAERTAARPTRLRRAARP
jgi:DNA transformation protein